MNTEIEDMLGFDSDSRPKPIRTKPRISRGDLHDLLTKALPQFLDPVDKVCNLHKLAKALHLSYQGVYKWMRPGRPSKLPKNQIDRIVALSEAHAKEHPAFTPVKAEEFWPFIASR